MGIVYRKPFERRISDASIDSWSSIPTAVISDELNRTGGMAAEIGPVGNADRFCGEAFPISTMVGDNLVLHAAVNIAPAGSVLVIDAHGFTQSAVWGEILHAVAIRQGVIAIVIDGAIRDKETLSASALPVFARGSVPNGPHKGWGGSINEEIHCGGVTVSPNDLVVGDADGVVVVPHEQVASLLPKCLARVANESIILKEIRSGESTVDLFGLEQVEPTQD